MTEKQEKTVNDDRLGGLLNAIEEMEGTDRIDKSDPTRGEELSLPSSGAKAETMIFNAA